jgi:NADH dehydrogenase
MKTLLVGPTGLLGYDICRYLSDAKHEVRALVRPTSDPSKRAALAALGVELVEGDLKDTASLARACAGVGSVISTASSTLSRQGGDSIESVDQQGQLALVEAARGAGVEHFVFVSFRENPNIRFPLSAAKRAVERVLTASGMAYTILQASYFMEVWLTPALGFDAANGKVRIYGDGTRPISWISYRDVARAAAMAVTEPKARNLIVELGGPEALSPLDVVRRFETAGTGAIATELVPEAALEAQQAGASDSLQQSFAGLMLQYAAGDAIDTATSSRLFPFPMTSVGDFITAQLAGARTSQGAGQPHTDSRL